MNAQYISLLGVTNWLPNPNSGLGVCFYIKTLNSSNIKRMITPNYWSFNYIINEKRVYSKKVLIFLKKLIEISEY